MLYNMICGTLPWDEQHLMKVVLGVTDDRPPPATRSGIRKLGPWNGAGGAQ